MATMQSDIWGGADKRLLISYATIICTTESVR